MLEVLLLLISVVFAIPFLVLTIEGASAMRQESRKVVPSTARLAVLIPAHNEASEIDETLSELEAQVSARDRILVVSDNSTDATVEIAKLRGVEVVRRFNAHERGKGYALAAGIDALAVDPPDVVVVLDADCRPEAGALRRIADRAWAEGRAIQGASLVKPDAGILSKISALAFHLRNDVRPRGLERLGLPALLQGTGMAIPWSQLEGVQLGSSHLAEDRKLGVDLALRGISPRFEPDARFWSALEARSSVSGGQRSRWERGHLAVAREEIPRLVQHALRERRPELGALALDLAVPPLALLVLAWLSSVVLAGFTGWVALAWLVTPGLAAMAMLANASIRSSSTPVPPGILLAAPLYALAKLPLYARATLGRPQSWERSRRAIESGEARTRSLSRGRSVEIGGVRFDALSEAECVNHVIQAADSKRGGWIATPNVDFLERSNRDPGFRALLRTTSLSVADGKPIVWAAQIAGNPLPDRVAGSDLISSLCAGAAAHGRSIFLLGGNPGTAEAAARVLRERNPGLRVAGWLCPPFGFENDDRELSKLAATLCATEPDLVFLGLGSPKAERLIASLRLTHQRKLRSTWWVGVGVSFSFLSGEIERAPHLLQTLGLEWTHRLWKEPRRLASRYLVRDLPYALRLLASSALQRALRPFAA
jgi:exopolysaccharide biosynthesis WecB/TagA/CpsF family protein